MTAMSKPITRPLDRRQLLQVGGIVCLAPARLLSPSGRNELTAVREIVHIHRAIRRLLAHRFVRSQTRVPDESRTVLGPSPPTSRHAHRRIAAALGFARQSLLPGALDDAPQSGHDGGMHVCMTGHSEPAVDTPYFGSGLGQGPSRHRQLAVIRLAAKPGR